MLIAKNQMTYLRVADQERIVKRIIPSLLSSMFLGLSLVAGEATALNWQQDCRYIYRLKIVEQVKKGDWVYPGVIISGWVYCDVGQSMNTMRQLSWGRFSLFYDHPYNGRYREMNGYFLQEFQKKNADFHVVPLKDEARQTVREESTPLPFLLGLGLLPLPGEPFECGIVQKVVQKIPANPGYFSGSSQGMWGLVDKNSIQRGILCSQLRLKAAWSEDITDENNEIVSPAKVCILGDLWLTKSGTLMEWSSIITRTGWFENEYDTKETAVSLTLEQQTNKNFDLYSLSSQER